VTRVDLGARGTFHRLLVGPLPDRAAAESLCEQLRSRHQGCIVR
jgi:cell division septation protein DedD